MAPSTPFLSGIRRTGSSGDRLLERRRKQAQFRDPQVTLVLLEEISEAALDGKRKEHNDLQQLFCRCGP